MEQVEIFTEYIKLGDFLKFCGAVETGGEAKLVIQDGHVSVNGERCTQRGKKLYNGDSVCIREKCFTVVGNVH